jgi:hypothetical protein
MQMKAMLKLSTLNNSYYTDSFLKILSWKNRCYPRDILTLIDIARTGWILVACSSTVHILFGLGELLYISYYIYHNIREIEYTDKYVSLIMAINMHHRDRHKEIK